MVAICWRSAISTAAFAIWVSKSQALTKGKFAPGVAIAFACVFLLGGPAKTARSVLLAFFPSVIVFFFSVKLACLLTGNIGQSGQRKTTFSMDISQIRAKKL